VENIAQLLYRKMFYLFAKYIIRESENIGKSYRISGIVVNFNPNKRLAIYDVSKTATEKVHHYHTE
jgi:hypothetical protein